MSKLKKSPSSQGGGSLKPLLAAAVAGASVPWIAVAATDIYGNEIKVVDGKTYQFLISGNPETAVTANSSLRPSDSTSLATGTRSLPTGSTSLEARYRTRLGSPGTGLKTTKFRHFLINFH